jgi:spermidine synthase
LLALLNSASYISGGKRLDISGSELMGVAKSYFISPAYAFVAYPNRDSVPFREWYNIPEAETVVRGTLRYQGFPEFIKALVDLGWLEATVKEWLTGDLAWAEVTQKTVGASSASETCVWHLCIHRIKTYDPQRPHHTHQGSGQLSR